VDYDDYDDYDDYGDRFSIDSPFFIIIILFPWEINLRKILYVWKQQNSNE